MPVVHYCTTSCRSYARTCLRSSCCFPVPFSSLRALQRRRPFCVPCLNVVQRVCGDGWPLSTIASDRLCSIAPSLFPVFLFPLRTSLFPSSLLFFVVIGLRIFSSVLLRTRVACRRAGASLSPILLLCLYPRGASPMCATDVRTTPNFPLCPPSRTSSRVFLYLSAPL